MPPTPAAPRLSTLEPDAVALDAARRVATSLGRLAWQLQPGLTVRVPDETDAALRGTQVYLSTLDLCAWAQRGAGDVEEVPDLLLAVVSVLSERPLDALRGVRDTPAELVEQLDESDPVALVCLAGWARLQVAQGERITGDQLAALAGLSGARVRGLRDAGELRAATEPERKTGTLYAAREVRRFLGARGVPGFGSAATAGA